MDNSPTEPVDATRPIAPPTERLGIRGHSIFGSAIADTGSKTMDHACAA